MNTEIGSDLFKALDLIQSGKTVAVPTETVYGLAADANNEEAVLSIFEAKGRPTSNPLILHFDELPTALPYTASFPQIFETLYAAFCPGPLTFIVPKSSLVSSVITGGQDTVALRFPKHLLLQHLLQKLGLPLAAPSANLYGQLSPTSALHVQTQLAGRIPYILDGGACDEGLESTIIGLIDQKVVVYRYGSITPEALSSVLGYLPEAKVNADGAVLTSGMVKHHYATQTPLFLGIKPTHEKELALQISLQQDPNIGGPQLALSTNGSMIEAARNLYATLHQADVLGLQKIYVAPFPNEGLGRAMNDRLGRAAAKFSQV